MPSATPEHMDRKVVPALVAMVLAVLVIANDITAMAVALPDIERDFDAASTRSSESSMPMPSSSASSSKDGRCRCDR